MVIDPLLKSYGGHHFSWCKAISEFCKRAGFHFRAFGHEDCEKDIARDVPVEPRFAHAVIEIDIKIRILGPLVAIILCNRRLLAALKSLDLKTLTSQDLVVFTGASIYQFDAIRRWHKSYAKERPRLAVYVYDNVSSSSNGRSKLTKLGLIVKYQLTRLFRESGEAASLFTESEATAKQYESLVGRAVTVLPFPSIISFSSQPKTTNDRLISYLGHARTEKGFELVANSIGPILAKWPEARFFIQCTDTSDNGMSNSIRAAVERVLGYGNAIEVEREYLTPIRYNEIFSKSGLLLLAYKAASYATRGSGIAFEAMLVGKPMVVSPHTWMSARLEEAGLGTFVMAEETVEALVVVVDRFLVDREKWTAAFSEAAKLWRQKDSQSDFFVAFKLFHAKQCGLHILD